MDRGKRDRQGGELERGPAAEQEGRTDSESTSLDGSVREKSSEAGQLASAAATMDFSSESAGGESLAASFQSVVEERNVRAKLVPEVPRRQQPQRQRQQPVELDEARAKQQQQQQQQRGLRPSGGKDRHTKVQTSKGLRDRRVRLSVATAIQFYDVQDRLGYDQPSKAVEWLLKKAKAAIDELPPPPAVGASGAAFDRSQLRAPASSSVQGLVAGPSSRLASGSFSGYPHLGLQHSFKEAEKQAGGLERGLLLDQGSSGFEKEGEAELARSDISPLPRAESRNKARERARERAKDRTPTTATAPSSWDPSSPAHSSSPQSFGSSSQRSALQSSSLEGSMYENLGYTSSFTSLLQQGPAAGAAAGRGGGGGSAGVPLVPFSMVQPHQTLYHQSSQFLGSQQSFQQALLQASSQQFQFPAAAAAAAAAAAGPAGYAVPFDFSGSASAPVSQLATSWSAAAGSLLSEQASLVFRPASPSEEPAYLFPRPPAPVAHLHPHQFSYSSLSDAFQHPSFSGQHHFVSPGQQRQFRLSPSPLVNPSPSVAYHQHPSSASSAPSTHQLQRSMIQELDDEMDELKHRPSPPQSH